MFPFNELRSQIPSTGKQTHTAVEWSEGEIRREKEDERLGVVVGGYRESGVRVLGPVELEEMGVYSL